MVTALVSFCFPWGTRWGTSWGTGEGVVQDCHFRPICALASWTESALLILVPVVPERKDCLSNWGELGDMGPSVLSKSTSYVFTPGLFRSLFGVVGAGWLGSLPNG